MILYTCVSWVPGSAGSVRWLSGSCQWGPAWPARSLSWGCPHVSSPIWRPQSGGLPTRLEAQDPKASAGSTAKDELGSGWKHDRLFYPGCGCLAASPRLPPSVKTITKACPGPGVGVSTNLWTLTLRLAFVRSSLRPSPC